MTEGLFPDRRSTREFLEQFRIMNQTMNRIAIASEMIAECLDRSNRPGAMTDEPTERDEPESPGLVVDLWDVRRGVKVWAFVAEKEIATDDVFVLEGVKHRVTQVSPARNGRQRAWVEPVQDEKEVDDVEGQ